ncbi:MAG: hypothetical protein COB49_12460 [Alphaproteobacteria bacterium]|nr:MAG: hypothetical protein COB49_12460 [Alphaproteobacteria bacterium]
MAYIRSYKIKTGKTKYLVEVRVSGSKNRAKCFNRKTDAKEWALQMEYASQRQAAGLPDNNKHTVADTIDRYIREYSKNYASFSSIKANILWWKKELGSRYLHTITPFDLVDCRNKLATSPKLGRVKGSEDTVPLYDEYGRPLLRSPRTIQKYLLYFSAVLTIACDEWGWISENPMMRVKKPKVDNERIRFLSDYYHLWPGEKSPRHWDGLSDAERVAVPTAFPRAYELPRLMEAFQHQFFYAFYKYKPEWAYNLFIIRLGTGLRPKEASHMAWEDNDLVSHPIVIVDLRHKCLILKKTKMDTRPRSKPLSGEPLKILMQMYKDRDSNNPLVFVRPDGKAPYDFCKRIQRAIREAGLIDFAWHDVRHTTASYLAMMGANQREIMEALHHRTLIASQRYQHIAESHMRNLLSTYNSALFDEREEMSRHANNPLTD